MFYRKIFIGLVFMCYGGVEIEWKSNLELNLADSDRVSTADPVLFNLKAVTLISIHIDKN